VGVRSSVLLPFDNLGLIIVDEEHDPSYKQQEPAPRYNARDVALMLGQFHHAKVLLGSATPSVESYFHAHQHRYGLVKLSNRFGESQLPQIEFADIRQERKKKTIKGEFSQTLLRGISTALAAKDQVIIFQNRRGYSPMIQCLDCGWIPKCQNCSVSLTYHQYRQALICHYCGYKEPLHTQCPSCSSTRILTLGYGTEKLEEELKLHFPESHVQRMDLDTTRSKLAYESLLEKFEKGDTDILVGTQMVTKGLDFDRVSLVGIFNADRMIHFPDFRSHERAFQLITQVSGRAGRRGKEGKVIIQTTHADHPLLATILHHDQATFYETQLSDRLAHHYPPFTRLIELIVKHADKKSCRDTANLVCDSLKKILKGVWILGPGEPIISKIKNQYQLALLIKIPRDKGDLARIKIQIIEALTQLGKLPDHRKSRIVIDVDPY
jgi:primosomal protein N' (replication factor Y)